MRKFNSLSIYKNDRFSTVDKNNVPIEDYTLCVTYPEDYIKYTTSNLITVNTQNGEKIISYDLLKDLIDDPALYSFLLYSMKEHYGITIKSYSSGESIFIDNVTINEAIQKVANDLGRDKPINKAKSDALTFNEERVVKELNKDIVISINQKDYHINESEIVKILISSKEEYDAFLNGNLTTKYPSNEMYMLLIEYIKMSHLNEKYKLPSIMIERINSLTNGMLYEKNSTNKLSSVIEKIKLNSELYKYLTRGIKNSDSIIQKVIKIYDTLCTLYTTFNISSTNVFNENLDAINNKNINDKTLSSNEFLIIFSYMLDSFNIEYHFGKKTMSIHDNKYDIDIDFSKVKNDMENGVIDYVAIINKTQPEIEANKLFELIKNTINENHEIIINHENSIKAINEYQATNKVSAKDRMKVLFGILEKSQLTNLELIIKLKKIVKNIFNNNELFSIHCFNKNNNLIIYIKYGNKVYLFNKNDSKVEKSSINELEREINEQIVDLFNDPKKEKGVEYVRKIS